VKGVTDAETCSLYISWCVQRNAKANGIYYGGGGLDNNSVTSYKNINTHLMLSNVAVVVQTHGTVEEYDRSYHDFTAN
jgi:hypothetical protein